MPTGIRYFFSRLAALFRSKDFDRDLNDEIKAHLDLLVQDNLRRGMDPAEAFRTARLELGGVTQLREAHRDTRGFPLVDTFLQDLRYTFRTLRRDAGFTTFAILIVGFGIGASATVFSLIDAMLIRPLPFRDPASLVWISNNGDQTDLSGLTVPVGPFTDLRNQTKAFSDIAAYFAFYSTGGERLTGGGISERLTGVPVTHNFFNLLGVHPLLGRTFTVRECQGAEPVVMISAALWQRRFSSDPAIIGRKIVLNDNSKTIIGVVPDSFDFASIFAPGTSIDLFSPFPLTAGTNRMGNTLMMIGRLKPGISLRQAQAEGNLLIGPIGRKWNRPGLGLAYASLNNHVSGRLQSGLFILFGAVCAVMLIVCVNLSNLQLARAATRQKEMAVRVAVGAGRGRLIRQMLTESVILSCIAALLGLGLAIGGTRLLANLDSLNLPLRAAVHVDGWVLGFTVLAAVLTGLLFGFVPAMEAPALAVHDSLRENARSTGETFRQRWIRGALVVSEVGFACVLLVGAGLLIRSFLRVLDTDLGFHPENTVTLRVDPNRQYNTRLLRNNYFNEVFRRVSEIPGVKAAGLTDGLPLGHNRSWTISAQGEVYTASHPAPDAYVHVVSDGYLPAMGISIREGRDLAPTDNAAAKPVVLINESCARALWPGQSALGRYLVADIARQVVGVVRDVHHVSAEDGSGLEFYIPMRQTDDYGSVNLVVRARLTPAVMASGIRSALRPLDPSLNTTELRTLQEIVDQSVSPRRFVAELLGGFGVFALILVSLGIYGVISYSVNRRTQDIGIRMALGASAERVQGGIILDTLALAVVGMVFGTACCWMATKALAGQLFGVTPTDPVTFIAVLAILSSVAFAASYLPARRASRIDPMLALRVS
ncbi:MAG TPA: ABC transporter permease [Bryobacteraceae bacterium]|jgi:predicted permease|nr:ABC transporter permease [Bryobacteraceae bacterium]